WQNSASLCWLDSMLVALVNCKSLKKSRPDVEPRQSTVWRLIREHEDVGSAVQGHRQTGSDGVARVPQAVLEKSHADLDRLRMSVFQQLQPKLHCKLGKKETPVFALPLLLAMDAWAEPLFRTLFHWEFKCTECGAATKERIWKTLPTFTDVVTDWHPLRAVHLAPCNRCSRSHQRRTMTLESVPPVFGLHFVQGLPSNDTGNYSFTFNRNHYSISTVIQYKHHLKHFVTWICHSNGSWQEYDDLKHPECRTHSRLPVPAEEMHIVFWEVEEGCKEPAGCSPSSSFSALPPPDHPGTSKPGG
uniref:USP domain-containing protein n=1 Tax=Tetraodon nigroviridis TaxID=99883 RepID=H3BW28_TETNG